MIIDQASNTEYEQIYQSLSYGAKLHRPSEFSRPTKDLVAGKTYGKPFCFEPRLSFREGEVTLWGGVNGHGKSLLTGQVALQLVEQKVSVAIMSFEMSPERTLMRMLRQKSLGRDKIAVEDVDPFLKYLDPYMVLLNYRGSITPEIVLGATVVANRDFGVTHVFIDNLMKVVRGEDDYNSQKDFVEECCTLAQTLNIHIHLIHHVRKGKDEDEDVGKFSFKGSGSIVDQVDNAILIQRNRKKERDRESGSMGFSADSETGDSILRIVKQRNGDFEGQVPLWFDPATTAFCKDVNRVPQWTPVERDGRK
jgi:twinkle protein